MTPSTSPSTTAAPPDPAARWRVLVRGTLVGVAAGGVSGVLYLAAAALLSAGSDGADPAWLLALGGSPYASVVGAAVGLVMGVVAGALLALVPVPAPGDRAAAWRTRGVAAVPPVLAAVVLAAAPWLHGDAGLTSLSGAGLLCAGALGVAVALLVAVPVRCGPRRTGADRARRWPAVVRGPLAGWAAGVAVGMAFMALGWAVGWNAGPGETGRRDLGGELLVGAAIGSVVGLVYGTVEGLLVAAAPVPADRRSAWLMRASAAVVPAAVSPVFAAWFYGETATFPAVVGTSLAVAASIAIAVPVRRGWQPRPGRHLPVHPDRGPDRDRGQGVSPQTLSGHPAGDPARCGWWRCGRPGLGPVPPAGGPPGVPPPG